MKRRVRCVAWLALMLSAPVAAEVCYGPAVATSVNPSADTLFTCPTAGTQTINALAVAGWRIVKMSPVSVGGSPTPLSAAQLVIQRPGDRVFRNGFDPD